MLNSFDTTTFTPKIDLSWLESELPKYRYLIQLVQTEKSEFLQQQGELQDYISEIKSKVADLEIEIHNRDVLLQISTNQNDLNLKRISDLQAKIAEFGTITNEPEKLSSVFTSEQLQRENDLIILQLHQLQEELEYYILNTIDNNKFEQQKELVTTTQEKLNLANEKYRKVTAQVDVLKSQLNSEYEKVNSARNRAESLNLELKNLKASRIYQMGSLCDKKAQNWWELLKIPFAIRKILKNSSLNEKKI